MLTILVVDDDHQIRAWVRRTLEFNGYHVEVAGDGKEALAYLKWAEPALILLDLFMPNVDGWKSFGVSGRVPSPSRFWRFPATRSTVTTSLKQQKCSVPTIF